MKKLTVNFDENGNPTVETSGCQGNECKKLTAGIEQALGKTVRDESKPEMHQQKQQTQNQ